jgi:hypothetical protein
LSVGRRTCSLSSRMRRPSLFWLAATPQALRPSGRRVPLGVRGWLGSRALPVPPARLGPAGWLSLSGPGVPVNRAAGRPQRVPSGPRRRPGAPASRPKNRLEQGRRLATSPPTRGVPLQAAALPPPPFLGPEAATATRERRPGGQGRRRRDQIDEGRRPGRRRPRWTSRRGRRGLLRRGYYRASRWVSLPAGPARRSAGHAPSVLGDGMWAGRPCLRGRM